MVGHALVKGGGVCGFDDLNHYFFDFGSAQRADQIHKKIATITVPSDGCCLGTETQICKP